MRLVDLSDLKSDGRHRNGPLTVGRLNTEASEDLLDVMLRLDEWVSDRANDDYVGSESGPVVMSSSLGTSTYLATTT